MDKVTAKDFEIEISKKRSIISIWTLPQYVFELEKLSDTKYFLHVKEGGEELFNANNVHFEIHFDEENELVDLYFYDGKAGRYLQAPTVVFDIKEAVLNVAQCINKRFSIMRELFVRHCLDEDTVPNVIEEEISFRDISPSDYSFCLSGENVVFTISKYFERYGKLSEKAIHELVTKTLNENGFFILSGNVWQNDGRYFTEELVEIELIRLGFVKNELLKDFI
jgi:hypothetical protein